MNEEYEEAAESAARELQQAQTADDVRKIWKKYYLVLGHRSLSRLLLGRSTVEFVVRREARTH
jgi:hypothetical protein